MILICVLAQEFLAEQDHFRQAFRVHAATIAGINFLPGNSVSHKDLILPEGRVIHGGSAFVP
jgi:hypothetical protein